MSTLECLVTGILNRPAVDRVGPGDITWIEVDEEDCSRQTIRSALESGAGTGVEACMYYGFWRIWHSGKGFSGVLNQYRRTTDSFDDLDIDAALDTAETWRSETTG